MLKCFLEYMKKVLENQGLLKKNVRLIGLEPTRRETPDPKSGAATNYATGASFPIFRVRFAMQR